jgi:anaerobic magnesium-protoporphyrin IX monomethyl ester cyclase
VRCMRGDDSRVIVIAMDQPLDGDRHVRKQMGNAENRAKRQSSRFQGLDIYGLQKEVHKHLWNLQFCIDGRYGGLLDLMNYLKNDRKLPYLDPENSSRFYTLANMITLNGVYLYQYLIREGYDPLIIQNYSLTDIEGLLVDRPMAICISSTFVYLDDVLEMASRIKTLDPEIPVIAGGILIKKVLDAGSDLSDQTLEWLSGFYGKVDAFVVEAQGEITLVRLLKAIREKTEWDKIPNLAFYGEGGKMVFTPRQVESTPIDATAISWDKIPKGYLRKALPVNTSRGCAYRCRFCSYHRLFPKVHYKSLDVLRDELRLVQRLGTVSHVRFTDDNFTANKNRLKSVLDMMIKEGFDFTWSSYARASSVTPELVRLMKASRCEFLNMGIESGSQTVLNNMDKRLERAQAMRAIRMLSDHGIWSEGGFIVGYPGETQETFSETVDFIEESGLPYYQPFLFYYSKDMLVHKDRDRFGLEGLGRAWRHNTMDSSEASALISQMIERIDCGFTNGLIGNWETFRLLRGEGYLPGEIFELSRLKRDLQLAMGRSPLDRGFSPEAERILRKLEAIIG